MSSEIELDLTLVSRHGETAGRFPVRRLIIAGWTGRDRGAMEKHIQELEALGVKRPASTPVFYRVSCARLTTTSTIQASGGSSSGEVESILANIDGEIWVGTGSDHTDREVETYGVTVSKQMCDKPIAGTLWPLQEVNDHWDQLIIRSFATIDGNKLLYQEGTLETLLSANDLLDRFATEHGAQLQPGDFMFGGTLPAIGGVRKAQGFEFKLFDPVLNRTISHKYDIEELAIHG